MTNLMMNSNSIKTVTVIGSMILLFAMLSSCEKWLDPDLNINPNTPSDVPMDMILPAIEQSIGYHMLGNTSVRTNNIWMQYFDKASRVRDSSYQLRPPDVNLLWISMYTDMFMNSKVYIEKAVVQESPHNQGVGKVLIAATLGMGTDLFGDMPFSKAFKGSEFILAPEFDSQEVLYDTLFALLGEAVTNLGVETDPIGIGGDVIYDGDPEKWEKAAYSIMARHKLQLSKVNGNNAYTEALALVASGFTSNTDDMEVPWESANKNPIYQFMNERTDIRMCGTFLNMLNDQDDPRIPFYFAKDGAGNYTGSAPGYGNTDASYPGSYNASEDSPTVIMSYAELKFIEAECEFLVSTEATALTALEEAVSASILKVTGSAVDADWLNENITSSTLTLEFIMNQKYLALYSTNQAFADWRRTGFPTLSLAYRTKTSEIPRRFPYAQDEINYNGANVPEVVITDRVWWDN